MSWVLSPAPPSWLNSPPSASHHQQWQNNWKTLCFWLSNIRLCVFPWSRGTAFVLLLPWPSSVRSMHSLRKASLPRWWTDIIKLLYLTILITGFIRWLHFCHKKRLRRLFLMYNLSNKRRNVIKVYFLEVSASFKDKFRPHSSHSLSFMVIVNKVKWAANIFTIVLYYLDR